MSEGSEPVTNSLATVTPRQRQRLRANALAALSECGSLVYAMRVEGDVVKIGFTTKADVRRRALAGDVLAVQFGTFADEQAIHARLADHRHHGKEWYYPTPGVMRVVNEMRDAMGMDPIAA